MRSLGQLTIMSLDYPEMEEGSGEAVASENSSKLAKIEQNAAEMKKLKHRLENDDQYYPSKEAERVHLEWERTRIKYLRLKAVMTALEDVIHDSHVSEGVRNQVLKVRFGGGGQVSDPQGQLGKAVAKHLRDTVESLLLHYPDACNEDLPDLVAKDVETVEFESGTTDLTEAIGGRIRHQEQRHLLAQILKNNYLGTAPKLSEAKAVNLEAKFETIIKKREFKRKELESYVHNASANLKLETVIATLDQQTLGVQAEMEESQASLAKYQAVQDQEYMDLVERYQHLSASIAETDLANQGLGSVHQ